MKVPNELFNLFHPKKIVRVGNLKKKCCIDYPYKKYKYKCI